MAAIHTGRRSAVGIALESTPGTAVTPKYWTPHQSISLENTPINVPDDSAIGVVEEAFDSRVLYSLAEGNIEGFIQDEPIGIYLKSVFGAVTPAAMEAPNAAVYNHTFTVSQTNTRPTITVTEVNPNTDRNFSMGVVRQLDIIAEARSWGRFSAGVISRPSAANGEPSTPAITLENKFPPVGITLKYADTVAGLGAGTTIPLRTFTASFTNGATDDPDGLGYSQPPGMISETFTSTISIEGLYRNDDLRGFAQLATKKAVGIYIVSTGVTIGDDQTPSLSFLFEPGFFSDWSKSNDLNAVVTQSATFNGLYAVSSSKSVQAVLKNLETSY